MGDAHRNIAIQNINLVGQFFEDRVGFRLNKKDERPFAEFVQWFSSKSNSLQVQKLKNRKRSSNGNWHAHFVNSIMVDTRKGFSASVYHLENMKRISSDVIDAIYKDESVVKALNDLFPGNKKGIVAPNNPAILDFEYQAYLLATRRTLEYLSKGINAYFLDSSTRIRKLSSSLNNAKPLPVSKALLKVLSEHDGLVGSFLSGVRITNRDLVAHHGYVPFGCLNIGKDGAKFCGENFPHGKMSDPIGIIEDDLNKLRTLLGDLLASIVEEDKKLSNS
jgi:hypothetical protein